MSNNPGQSLLAVNNYYYHRGGAEVLFFEHNKLLERCGWEIVPFAMHHPRNVSTPWSAYFPDEIEFGAQYTAYRKIVSAARVLYSRQAQHLIEKVIAASRPSIAHVHNIYHHLSPAILPAIRRAGIPVVMTLHDLKLACPAYTMMLNGQPCERCRHGQLYNVMLNRCIKQSRALSSLVFAESVLHRALGSYENNVSVFIAPSRFMLSKMVEWGWPQNKFEYVPNFVDVGRIAYDAAPGSSFVYVGRLDALKGIGTLIQAAALAGQRLIIVGSGPDEVRLRRLGEELGADVVFAGHQSREAVAALVRFARAVVLPSEVNENAPLSILEAYAAGRPVIGSRIAGIPELIRDGETGYLFDPGDPQGLAERLLLIARHPDSVVSEMGRRGREWVERDFSTGAYLERMLSIYMRLLG